MPERNFEPKCHVCQFIRHEPEIGEMIEAWIISDDFDNRKVADWLNDRYDQATYGDWIYKWIDTKKIRTHKEKHLTDSQEIYRRAQEKGLTGRTLEAVAARQMTAMQALSDRAVQKIQSGEIQPNTLNDALGIFERHWKLMGGGDNININLGTSGQGVMLPPQLFGKMISVMNEFVPEDNRAALRKKLDEEVYPEFAAYVEEFESQQPTPEPIKQLPSDIEQDPKPVNDEEDDEFGPERL